MLQTATVYPRTLEILKEVMSNSAFNQFNLVGGTSLSLQIGHRISIDLDLFTFEDYDNEKIIAVLNLMGDLEILSDKPPFLQVRLDDVKMDFLKFPYPIVKEYFIDEGVRLVDVENIAVMKLIAIARRGVKKDFFDLYFILEKYSMPEIVAIFKKKMPHIDMFHILKSLSYFSDADPEPDPNMLIKVSWAKVKKTIIQKAQAYLKNPN
jgi:predicted nucleotidyltransferase component of viral defense system